jgi:hypothetical protein
MKKFYYFSILTLCFCMAGRAAEAQCNITLTPQGVCSGTPFTGASISSGTHVSSGNQTITSQNVIMSGGTLIICSDTLTVTSSQLHIGFNATGPVQFIVNAGATLNIALSNLYLYSNATITNYGTINLLSGGASFIAGYTNSTLVNASSGVIQSSVPITMNGISGTIVNYGRISAQALTVSATSNICLGSNSRFSATNLTNAGTNHSMFNLASGAGQGCLQLAPGSTYTAGGSGNVISNASGVRICSGSATTPTTAQAGSATVSYSCTSCSVALPLQINSFNAQKSGDQALLSLTTVDEQNIMGFELERSTPEGGFKQIGSLVLAGNHTNNKYSFTDEQPYAGVNLYRVKITELNNFIHYTQVSSLNFASSDRNVNIYPNPAGQEIKVDLTAIKPTDKISISLADLAGRNIAQLYEGSNETAPSTYSLQNIVPGIYIMRVAVNGALIAQKKMTVIR